MSRRVLLVEPNAGIAGRLARIFAELAGATDVTVGFPADIGPDSPVMRYELSWQLANS